MPQFNFQPIYSKYAGNTLDLEDKLLTKKEEEYKVGEQYIDTYDKLRKSMQSSPLSTDIEAVNNLSKSALEDIKQFTDKGDYENLYNKIKGSVVDLQSKYAPYAQNLKNYYEGVKELRDKNKWSEDYINLQIAKSKQKYEKSGGLKIDPSTGLANNYFSMDRMGEYLNPQKELASFMKEVTINKNGYDSPLIKASIIRDANGNFVSGEVYDKKFGVTKEVRTMNELLEVGKNFLTNSPEIQSVINKQAELDAFAITNSPNAIERINNVNNYIDKNIKSLQESIKSIDNGKMVGNKENLYKQIDDLQKTKIDPNKDIESIESKLHNILANKYSNDDVYNVADMLDVNNTTTKTTYLQGQRFKAEEGAIKKKVIDANTLLSAATNSNITPKTFNQAYNLINDSYQTSKTNYESSANNLLKSFGKTYIDRWGKEKANQNMNNAIDDLKSLNITNGYTDENIKKIAEVFNKNGFALGLSGNNFQQTKNFIANNIKNIETATTYKNTFDDVSYEQGKLNSYLETKIPIKVIKDFATKEKISNEEAKNLIYNNLTTDDKTTLLAQKANMERLAPKENLLKSKDYLNVVHKLKAINLLKENNINLNFNDYSEQNFGFTNSDKESTIKEVNDNLTEHFKSIGIDNLVSKGVSIIDIFNSGVPLEGGKETIKPKNPILQNATILSGNQFLLTMKEGDKTFKITVDADSDNGNLASMYNSKMKQLITSDTPNKVKEMALSSIADNIIPKNTWGNLYNLKNKDSREVTTTTGNRYLVTNNNGSYILTTFDGQPLIKGEPTIFSTLDALKLQIGRANFNN